VSCDDVLVLAWITALDWTYQRTALSCGGPGRLAVNRNRPPRGDFVEGSWQTRPEITMFEGIGIGIGIGIGVAPKPLTTDLLNIYIPLKIPGVG
jgi:hypothetical protein